MSVAVEGKRVHCGPVFPFCDVSNVKVFIFGDLRWPRPKDGPVPDYREWGIYWATPAFLRRYGVGVTQGVRRSIERENHWREKDRKFKHVLNQLCGALLEADFIERAVVYIKQERREVIVEISRWFNEREMRLWIAWYDFHDVVNSNFLNKVEYDLWIGHEKLKLFERKIALEENDATQKAVCKEGRFAGKVAFGLRSSEFGA